MSNLFSDKYQTKRRIGLGVFLTITLIYFFLSLAEDVNRDINSMDAHDLYHKLQEVPYIEDEDAVIIIENRPYHSWDDLRKLDGINSESIYYLRRDFVLIYPIIVNRFKEGGEYIEVQEARSN